MSQIFDLRFQSDPPVRKSNWRVRRGRSSNKKVLDGNIDGYKWQSGNLYECLKLLKSHRSFIEKGINKYLKVIFLPKDINDAYLELLRHKGISFLNKNNQAGVNNYYFEITSYSNLEKYLDEAIDEFKKFASGEINQEKFNNKVISVWANFGLNTSSIKNQASNYINKCSKLKLDVWLIKSVPELSKIAADFNFEVYGSKEKKILYIDDCPDDLRKTKDFIEKIASIDDVGYISLNRFMSQLEENPLSGVVEKINVKVKKIQKNAPVVGVIDSGVCKNMLTEDCLLSGLDYFTNSDTPLLGDPNNDQDGHGTRVACEIIYGRKNIQDYFLHENTPDLLPLVKIFPVKVFGEDAQNDVPYDKIFDLNGEFAKSVQEFKIKIVNLSFNNVKPKNFCDESLSKNAHYLDNFSRKYGVIFVVSTGNIEAVKLKLLAQKYPNLCFYQRPKFMCYFGNDNFLDNEINISAPSDLLSGISVGSCFKQNNKYVPSSFSKSFSLEVKGSKSRPDVLASGGDYPIDFSNTPPEFILNGRARLALLGKEKDRLTLQVGTSFSAPRVSRALAIALIKYPNISAEELKCVFLHKSLKNKKRHIFSNTKKGESKIKKTLQSDKITFHSAFGGHGILLDDDEDLLFSDNENEVTFITSSSIKNREIKTFSMPMAKMLGGMNGKDGGDKLQIKISLCAMPISTLHRPKTLREANNFHISAVAHVKSLSPTYTYHSLKGHLLKDQCITHSVPTFKNKILINWTSDYSQSKENPTFVSKSSTFTKDTIKSLLGQDDVIHVSVRGFHRDKHTTIENHFCLVFSIEDLGATGDIRNHINVTL
jgi:hypothetical protein